MFGYLLKSRHSSLGIYMYSRKPNGTAVFTDRVVYDP